MTADARFALYVARSLTRERARQYGEGGTIDSEATDPHWVVPPIRTAGWAFRRLAMLVRQLFVPIICVYPGKAKYSIDTLTRDGSTAAAPEGGVDGTATARTWHSHTNAARIAENRAMLRLPPGGGAGMVDDEGGVPEAIRREPRLYSAARCIAGCPRSFLREVTVYPRTDGQGTVRRKKAMSTHVISQDHE